MKNLAANLEPVQPWLDYGEVINFKENKWIIKISTGEIAAKTATSCLVKPDIGDKVLISIDEQGICFILSILEKAKQENVTEIIFNKDVNLCSLLGEINLISNKNISIVSEDKLHFASNNFSLSAQKGKIMLTNLSFIGKKIKANLKKIKLVCISIEHVLDRLTQKIRNSFKFVKEHDEVQSNSSRYLVEDTLTMQSKNAVHMAEEIVSINAEQVHLN